MNRQKIALTALLIAVIAAAAVFAVVRVRANLQAPTTYLEHKFKKIDMNSFEVFDETVSDWRTRYAPDAGGHYKNPRTGEYTMVDVMTCASCGQFIPVPKIPAEIQSKAALEKYMPPPGKRGRGPPEMVAKMAALKAWASDYKCPRCGKNAFVFPATPVQTNADEQKKLSDQKKADEQKKQSDRDLESAQKPIQELLGK